jgi:hypothetical protein
MAGLRPGHPRERDFACVRVDTRHTAGHDGGGSGISPGEGRPIFQDVPTIVMAGLRPGHPRERDGACVPVDTRHKAGHDWQARMPDWQTGMTVVVLEYN